MTHSFSMSAPWRERAKGAVPQVIHVARLGRMMANQIRYPVAATCLDWQGKVIGGPFRGMRYPRSGIGSFFEILGTYEQCLIPLIEEIIERQPKTIIDVGAGYGYYALGFARRCPTSKVIAYEMDATRAGLIRKYSRLNRLDSQVEVRGECTLDSLAADLSDHPGPLVFMDVEGAEDFLLRPDQVPPMRHTEIVVELHEMYAPGVTARLRERFADTHRDTMIRQTPIQLMETLDAADSLKKLIKTYWSRMTREARAFEMAWLHLAPRTLASTD